MLYVRTKTYNLVYPIIDTFIQIVVQLCALTRSCPMTKTVLLTAYHVRLPAR